MIPRDGSSVAPLEGTQAQVHAFLVEIESVCRKHALSIAHEDHHGAFEIEEFSEDHMAWLHAAHIDHPKCRWEQDALTPPAS